MNLHLIHTNSALAACWLAETSHEEVSVFLAKTTASQPSLGVRAGEVALALNQDFPGFLPDSQILLEEWNGQGRPGVFQTFAFLVEAEIRLLNPPSRRLGLLGSAQVEAAC